MANYNIIVGSKFKPFSFERYLKPYQLIDEEYRDQEKILTELQDKANTMKQLALQNPDSKVAQVYNAYEQQLKDYVEEFSNSKLNQESRAKALGFKTRFGQELSPIDVGYKKQLLDIERQQKVSDATKGKTLFTRNAATTSIDDYVYGKVGDWQQVNLDDVYNQGLKGAAAASSRYSKTTESTLFKNQYLNLITEEGLSPEEAAKAMEGATDEQGNLLYPEFEALRKQIKDEIGYSAYSKDDQAKIDNALLTGMSTGIVYKKDDKQLENWALKEATQYAHQRALQAQKYQDTMNELAAQQGGNDGGEPPPETGLPVSSHKQVFNINEQDKAESSKKYVQDAVDFLAKQFGWKNAPKNIPLDKLYTKRNGKVYRIDSKGKYTNPVTSDELIKTRDALRKAGFMNENIVNLLVPRYNNVKDNTVYTVVKQEGITPSPTPSTMGAIPHDRIEERATSNNMAPREGVQESYAAAQKLRSRDIQNAEMEVLGLNLETSGKGSTQSGLERVIRNSSQGIHSPLKQIESANLNTGKYTVNDAGVPLSTIMDDKGKLKGEWNVSISKGNSGLLLSGIINGVAKKYYLPASAISSSFSSYSKNTKPSKAEFKAIMKEMGSNTDDAYLEQQYNTLSGDSEMIRAFWSARELLKEAKASSSIID